MQCHDPIFNLTYADNMQVGVLGVLAVGGEAEADLAVAGALVGLQTAEAMLAWVPLAQVSKPAVDTCAKAWWIRSRCSGGAKTSFVAAFTGCISRRRSCYSNRSCQFLDSGSPTFNTTPTATIKQWCLWW